jgi:hypothetical protein
MFFIPLVWHVSGIFGELSGILPDTASLAGNP